MAKTLDFNLYDPPSLPLVMRDPEKTTIEVTAPIEAVIEELMASSSKLDEALEKKGVESIKYVYEVSARIMSYNKQGIQITPLDLRDKYKLNFEMLEWFLRHYFDFLGEVRNEKN